ncbi:hypothetical protein ACFWHT_02330 [Microbacterium sp. NPDC058342]|uniref:hypothetical protein n=1 Tax=Microbacterium sp. NPDC058342 TaxID=3346454 RepID=UPI00365EDFD7
MSPSRLVPSILVLAGAVMLAAGCSTAPSSPAPTSTATGSGASGPAQPDERSAGDIEVAWLDGGRSFAVVTWGSSSAGCRPVADGVTGKGQNVDVTLADPPGDAAEACTDDLVPRAAIVGVPEGVDAAQDVEVRVTYGDVIDDESLDGFVGALEPGLSTGDQGPSAGWFDDRGLVLLTWGSSSCQPQVERIEQSGAGATVTFADIDGVCTMDFAPRTTVVVLDQEPADDDSPFTLTLQGGGLDGTVDVLG